MEKTAAVNKILNWCREQIGYHEGTNNYNKYAETEEIENGNLYGWNPQNNPWCDVFIDAGFIQCFGYSKACELTYQYSGCTGAACMYSMAYYKNNGALVSDPEPGDQIFFYAAGCIGHTGIVESVVGNTVTTIEGNSSDMVARRTYSIGSSQIAGYGRPKWSCLSDTSDGSGESNGTGSDTEYTVQRGDTLWGIAVKKLGSGLKYKELMEINNLSSPIINAGMVLKLKADTEDTATSSSGGTVTATVENGSTRTHTVQKGESLWSIAIKELGSGLRYKEIKTINNLTSDTIHPGDVLQLPDK